MTIRPIENSTNDGKYSKKFGIDTINTFAAKARYTLFTNWTNRE